MRRRRCRPAARASRGRSNPGRPGWPAPVPEELLSELARPPLRDLKIEFRGLRTARAAETNQIAPELQVADSLQLAIPKAGFGKDYLFTASLIPQTRAATST